MRLNHDVVDDALTIAWVIEDPAERRPLIDAAARRWERQDADRIVAQSPLIEVTPLEP